MLERATRLVGLALSLACCTHTLPERESGALASGGSSQGNPASGGGVAIGAGGTASVGLGGGVSSSGASPSGGQSNAATGNGGGSAVNGGSGGTAGTSAALGGAAGSAGYPADTPGTPAAPFKFPQNYRSSYCSYPSGVSSLAAQKSFAQWKTDLVRADSSTGLRRVIRPDMESGAVNTTVSEGIGYGMILAVVMDEQALFDEFWQYSQHHLNGNGLMQWLIAEDGSTLGEGAATDADEDMAWALALAATKWGGKGSLSDDYLNLAKAQIGRIWDHEVAHDHNELLIAGDSWGPGVVPFNPSYFAPNEYRLFGKLTNNVDGWNKVIDRGYDLLKNTLSSSSGNLDNGLVAAWTNDSGVPSAPFMDAPLNYQYDSARIPFRIGLDYCDFGEARAKAHLAKTSQFFAGLGASNIVDGYELDGTPKPENAGKQAALFVGAPGVGAMSDAQYQSYVDDTYGLLASKELRPKSYYFNLSWEVFSLLMLSGNIFDYSQH